MAMPVTDKSRELSIKTLANANKSRVSIRDRLCKIFLTFSLITMQNSAIVSQFSYCVRAGPKSLGDAEAPPPWDLRAHSIRIEKQ